MPEIYSDEPSAESADLSPEQARGRDLARSLTDAEIEYLIRERLLAAHTAIHANFPELNERATFFQLTFSEGGKVEWRVTVRKSWSDDCTAKGEVFQTCARNAQTIFGMQEANKLAGYLPKSV
jgi:hypothetical protein